MFRKFVLASLLLTAGCSRGAVVSSPPPRASQVDVVELTIGQVQADYAAKKYTAVQLVQAYLDRIATYEPHYNAFISMNPNALKDAAELDRELAQKGPRGPLHGVPIVVKDNIDVAGLVTTAGFSGFSKATGGIDMIPAQDADVVATTFAPCPTDGSACRIMPLGDSITFGIGSSGGGYRVELFRQALAAQRDVTFVGVVAPGGQNAPNGPTTVNGQPFPRNHEGFSGFTISGGGAGSLAGLVDDAIAQTDPNIILLHIGTNDVNGNINVAQAPQRLGALLDQILNDAPDALLVVAQIIPSTNQQTNTRVQAYNAAIPALVQARAAAGKHIELVDLFTPFSSSPNFASLMNDFLHPNDSGYVVMGQSWFQAIEAVLPQP